MQTLKLVSPCCQAKCRVNMRDGGYFCAKCGKDATPKATRKPASTLSQVRKPTGERELFIQLWAKQKGLCAVSGERLLPPEHQMFHWQGSHLLPKGTYPEDRLNPMNVVMILPKHHEQWGAEGDKSKLVAQDARWKPIVDLYHMLLERAKQRKRYQTHGSEGQ